MSKKLLTLVYWLVVFCLTQSTQVIAYQHVDTQNNVPNTSAFFKLIKNSLKQHTSDVCRRNNTSIVSSKLNVKDNTFCVHPFIITTGNPASAELKGISLIDLLGDINNNPFRLKHHGRFAAFTYQFLGNPCFVKLTRQLQYQWVSFHSVRIPAMGIDNADNKSVFKTKVILARTAG